mgnify:CR=1 FL=1
MGYWVSIHGRRFGPHSGGQIRTMLHSGQIPGAAEVWIPAESRWIPAPELAPTIAQVNTGAATLSSGIPAAAGSSVDHVPIGIPGSDMASHAPGRPFTARFNPLAVTCLVLALVSLPLLAVVVGFAIAVLAVVVGHRALNTIERSRANPVPQRGTTLAVIGLIVGYLSICVGAVVMVPAMLALPILNAG